MEDDKWEKFNEARVTAIVNTIGEARGRDIERSQLLVQVMILARLETITQMMKEVLDGTRTGGRTS